MKRCILRVCVVDSLTAIAVTHHFGSGLIIHLRAAHQRGVGAAQSVEIHPPTAFVLIRDAGAASVVSRK